jgi:hypothetical protein
MQMATGIVGGISGLLAGGAQAAPGLATVFSDERTKTNVKDVKSSQFDELLSALKAKQYDYKRKEYGGKDNTGVMAQDLEKSEIGRTMVLEVPTQDGPRKVVDLKRALAAALASSAHLHHRIKKLEKEAA